jgi:hypothetical protein
MKIIDSAHYICTFGIQSLPGNLDWFFEGAVESVAGLILLAAQLVDHAHFDSRAGGNFGCSLGQR